MNFDDYRKWQDDLLRSMREPLREAERLRRMYDEMLHPLRQLDELMKPPLHREFERYQEQQKQLEQLMRPVVSDINAMKSITAGFQVEPALSFLQDYRRMTEDLRVPQDLRDMLDGVGRAYERSMPMSPDIERMLGMLAPYANVAPALPSGDTLDAIRQQVAELRKASADRVSEAVTGIIRWLLVHAPRLDRKTVSFIIFTIIYPLVLTIYQPDIQKFVRPKNKQSKKKLEQQVVRVVTDRVPAAALSNLRFVSSNSLIVRVAPRKNSGRVSTLHAADVVLVIRTRKDWTYIEYRVEDAEIRGWVYTRYLRRFPSSG